MTEIKYETTEPILLGPGESKAAKFLADDGSEHMFVVSVSQDGVVMVITDDGTITADEYSYED